MEGERCLREVVSTRSLAELLDPASPGLLIKPTRGIRVPGGWLGCWVAGQGRGSEVSSRLILIGRSSHWERMLLRCPLHPPGSQPPW